MQIRTCNGPRNIRPDGSRTLRVRCGSTNVKVVQPEPGTYITYYCYDCHWTNVELAKTADQMSEELDALMAAKDATFGFMGDETPEGMPENVVSLFRKDG